MTNQNDFWKNKNKYNPVISEELIAQFETEFGYRLPASYIHLLKTANGGVPYKKSCKTDIPTSWSKDTVGIIDIKGIRLKSDGKIDLNESEYWSKQILGYEKIVLLMLCDCPSGGHDVVMLDYRECHQPSDEPSVVHMDMDYKSPKQIARNFQEFLDRLFVAEEDED